jgi:hypothetical protein
MAAFVLFGPHAMSYFARVSGDANMWIVFVSCKKDLKSICDR